MNQLLDWGERKACYLCPASDVVLQPTPLKVLVAADLSGELSQKPYAERLWEPPGGWIAWAEQVLSSEGRELNDWISSGDVWAPVDPNRWWDDLPGWDNPAVEPDAFL